MSEMGKNQLTAFWVKMPNCVDFELRQNVTNICFREQFLCSKSLQSDNVRNFHEKSLRKNLNCLSLRRLDRSRQAFEWGENCVTFDIRIWLKARRKVLRRRNCLLTIQSVRISAESRVWRWFSSEDCLLFSSQLPYEFLSTQNFFLIFFKILLPRPTPRLHSIQFCKKTTTNIKKKATSCR